MPFVQVTLVEGRSPEQLRSMISAVTSAVADNTGVAKESVRVVVSEVPFTHWASGDVTFAERVAGNPSLAPGAAPST